MLRTKGTQTLNFKSLFINFLESVPPIIHPRAPPIAPPTTAAVPAEEPPTMIVPIIIPMAEQDAVTKSRKNSFFKVIARVPPPQHTPFRCHLQ